MAKTLYEGYRIGKNGGERWVGTVKKEGRDATTGLREVTTGRILTSKLPKGGSAISTPKKAS